MTSQEAINEIDYMLTRNSYNEKRELALRCAVFHLTRAKQHIPEKETILAIMHLIRTGQIGRETTNQDVLNKVLEYTPNIKDF